VILLYTGNNSRSRSRVSRAPHGSRPELQNLRRIKRATSRPRLTVDISAALKRRIKVAAAAQDMPVSAYVARVLEQAVPAADTLAKASHGTISLAMIRRAAALRAEQKTPFPEHSADLIREAREQRYGQL
jgi:hypothetical protein